MHAVGEVPLKWYKDEEHIGYDLAGAKLLRKARKDKIDELLDRNDNIKAWRTIYDEYNDEEITLSKEEIELIQRIRQGQFPHVEVTSTRTKSSLASHGRPCRSANLRISLCRGISWP